MAARRAEAKKHIAQRRSNTQFRYLIVSYAVSCPRGRPPRHDSYLNASVLLKRCCTCSCCRDAYAWHHIYLVQCCKWRLRHSFLDQVCSLMCIYVMQHRSRSRSPHHGTYAVSSVQELAPRDDVSQTAVGSEPKVLWLVDQTMDILVVGEKLQGLPCPWSNSFKTGMNRWKDHWTWAVVCCSFTGMT